MIFSETNFKLDEAIHTYRINVINHSISIEADNRVILNFQDVESNSFDSTKSIFKIEENSLYRSILLDDIEVKKINKTIDIKVVSMVNGTEDTQNLAGTITLNKYEVLSGEKIQI